MSYNPQNPDRRPLPPGWVQEYNADYQTWFYVNTSEDPPRSSWEHPLGPPPPQPPPQQHVPPPGPPTRGFSGGYPGPPDPGYQQPYPGYQQPYGDYKGPQGPQGPQGGYGGRPPYDNYQGGPPGGPGGYGAPPPQQQQGKGGWLSNITSQLRPGQQQQPQGYGQPPPAQSSGSKMGMGSMLAAGVAGVAGIAFLDHEWNEHNKHERREGYQQGFQSGEAQGGVTDYFVDDTFIIN